MAQKGEEGLQEFLRALQQIGGPATLAEVSFRTGAVAGTDWGRGHKLILMGQVIREKVRTRYLYRLATQTPLAALPARCDVRYTKVNQEHAAARVQVREAKEILAITRPVHTARQLAMGVSLQDATSLNTERMNKLGA